MSKIQDAIAQVTSREFEASQVLDRARAEAELLASRAEEEGRREYQRLLAEAHQEAERLRKAGSSQTAAIREKSAAETARTLNLLEKDADERVSRAADRLLALFRQEQGLAGPGN